MLRVTPSSTAHPSRSLLLYLHVHPYIRPSIHPSIHLSNHPSIRSSILLEAGLPSTNYPARFLTTINPAQFTSASRPIVHPCQIHALFIFSPSPRSSKSVDKGRGRKGEALNRFNRTERGRGRKGERDGHSFRVDATTRS